jgi:hypothetical protein
VEKPSNLAPCEYNPNISLPSAQALHSFNPVKQRPRVHQTPHITRQHHYQSVPQLLYEPTAFLREPRNSAKRDALPVTLPFRRMTPHFRLPFQKLVDDHTSTVTSLQNPLDMFHGNPGLLVFLACVRSLPQYTLLPNTAYSLPPKSHP